MRASPWTLPARVVEPAARRELLDLARRAIGEGLRAGTLPAAPAARWSESLSASGASFVTLSRDGALRGCCGTIEPSRALALDVWANAWRTAFQDPRFPPLQARETRGMLLEISVLGPLERLPVGSEQELLAELRPGTDGLLLTCGGHRATFLPKVWDKIPDAPTFVRQLKRKMGVADDFWDDAMVVRRYATEEFGEPLEPATSGPAAGTP